MSIIPKVYHNPEEVKCGGVGMCHECTQKRADELNPKKKTLDQYLEMFERGEVYSTPSGKLTTYVKKEE